MKIFIVIFLILSVNDNCFCVKRPEAQDEEQLISGLEEAIKNQNINIICLTRHPSWGSGILPLSDKQIDGIFQKIQQKLGSESFASRWTFVIFSECFWGMFNPLKDETVLYIVEKCKFLTKNHNKVIIHITFTHSFCKSIPKCEWLHGYCIDGGINPSERITRTSLKKPFKAATEQDDLRLSNYSLMFYKENPISIYRKSTYHQEADDLISENRYVYEFGNFNDLTIADNFLAKQLIGKSKMITTRICSDMNDSFLQTIQLKNKGILFIPAQGVPNFYRQLLNEFKQREIKDILICKINDTEGAGLFDCCDIDKIRTIKHNSFENCVFYDIMCFLNIQELPKEEPATLPAPVFSHKEGVVNDGSCCNMS
jgi:hypothetical protein